METKYLPPWETPFYDPLLRLLVLFNCRTNQWDEVVDECYFWLLEHGGVPTA
jgi:hypothetical protein